MSEIYKLVKAHDQNPDTYKREEFILEYARYKANYGETVKIIGSDGKETYYLRMQVHDRNRNKR